MTDRGKTGRQARVFLNSLPKGGTHLLLRLLLLLGYGKKRVFVHRPGPRFLLPLLLSHAWSKKDSVLVGVETPFVMRASYVRSTFARMPPGTVVRWHALYSDHLAALVRSSGIKGLLMLRDPRDVAVSHVHHVCSVASHPLHRYYTQELGSFRERLAFSITGGVADNAYLESIGNRARSLDGWIDCPEILTVKFEELVGPLGGGDAGQQRKCVEHICEFLEDAITPVAQNAAIAALYGGSSTFRKGQIGSWREDFDEGLVHLFRSMAEDVLVRWGYEE